MNLTNNSNIHEGLFHAISAWFTKDQSPRSGYFRATELINPIQQTVLIHRYRDKIEVDAASLISAWRGSAVHEYLSRHDEHNVLKEAELETEVAGVRIVGHPDRYDAEGRVDDYKNCKVWKVVFKDFQDWEQQLNIYKYLLEVNGFPVTSLNIIAMFDDWKPSEARRGGDYPQSRGMTIPIPTWSREKALRFLKERVNMLMFALESLEDSALPECTEEEMWSDPTVYAVMKEGRKSAFRRYETEAAANKHVEELGAKHYLEVRPGRRKRCEDYCSAAPFCCQWQKYLQENGEKGEQGEPEE